MLVVPAVQPRLQLLMWEIIVARWTTLFMVPWLRATLRHVVEAVAPLTVQVKIVAAMVVEDLAVLVLLPLLVAPPVFAVEVEVEVEVFLLLPAV